MITSKTEINTKDPILRIAMYDAFDGKCFYTGRCLDFKDIHIDHVIPIVKGGDNCIENYVLCSSYINLKKLGHSEKWRVNVILETLNALFVKKVVEAYNQVYFNRVSLNGRITLRDYFNSLDTLIDKQIRSNLSTKLNTHKEIKPIKVNIINKSGEISYRNKLYYKIEDIENVLRGIKKI